MIIAIDFDNTIVKTSVVETTLKIKRLKFLSKKIINKLYNDGHIIIIDTLRTNGNDQTNKNSLTIVKNYLKEKGINYHYINENYPPLIKKWGDARKISCDISIDDRNIIPLVSWPIIYLIIKLKTWLKKN